MLFQPSRNEVGNLGVVLLLEHEVAVALDILLGQVDDRGDELCDTGLAHHSLHSPWRGHTQRVFPPDDTGMKAQNSATKLLFLLQVIK